MANFFNILSTYAYPFLGDDLMNCIIPFEKRVSFTNPVKEICSISLEHEITQNENEVLGNFIISGTYKEHELSVNTSEFKFVIPFNVELTNRIERDTLEFSIDNFTYDIDGADMIVKIDYIVNADDVREDVIIEPEEILDPFDLISDDEEENVESEEIKEEEIAHIKEDKRHEEIIKEPTVEPVVTLEVEENKPEPEEERDEVDPQIVSSLETENDYMTYHIHIVKESETAESIALTYKMTKDDLEKFNVLDNLMQGDKLIIPLLDE